MSFRALLSCLIVISTAGIVMGMGRGKDKDSEVKEVKSSEPVSKSSITPGKPEPAQSRQVKEAVGNPVAVKGVESNPVAVKEEANRVLVKVDDEPIMLHEVNKAMEPQLKQMAGRATPEQLESMKGRMRQQIVDMMITSKLIEKELQAKDIEIGQEAIDARLTEVAQQRNMSLEDFKAQLFKQGLTKEELNKQVKLGIGMQKLFENEAEGQLADITEKQVHDYYDNNTQKYKQEEQVKASHILFDTRGKSEEEKAKLKEKAQEVLKEVKKPESDFAALAKEHSACPSSAKGGDLGFFAKGRMVKPFSDAAFAMEPGQISDELIETQFGYHIIKVTDRKDAGQTSYEDAKDQIKEMLEGQQKREFAQGYLADMKDKADIEYIDESVKPQPRPQMRPGGQPREIKPKQ